MNSVEIGLNSKFGEVEIHKALELLGEHGPIGRKRLAENLNLGEGSMRTLLDHLKEEDYVSSAPRGHSLTDEGKHELSRMEERFLKFNAGSLTVGKIDVATTVRRASDGIKRGIAKRDEAIKAGAKGATILVFENGDLRFPKLDFEIDPQVKSNLKDHFQVEEGDVIIIGTADNELDAERGTLAAAKTISS